MLIASFTVDVNGNESPDNGDAPVREDWIYGEAYEQAFVTDAVYTMKTTDCVVTLQGTNQVVNLPPSASIRRYPRYIIHNGVGTATIVPAPGDTVQNNPNVTIQPGDRITIMPSS